MPKMKDMPYIFGLKLRFWPSGQQKVMVEKNAEAARFVYNRLVSMSRELYDKKKTALSRYLLEKHDTEYAEDLKTKNLLHNHHLAKAINDVSWSQFLLLCSRKAAEHGKKFVKVPPQNTTQTCSCCGYVCSGENHLDLYVEEWTCPRCGTHHVRDHNAAENILARGRMLQRKEKEKKIAA